MELGAFHSFIEARVTVILFHAVVRGCECGLTQPEEGLEISALRRMFGLKWQDVKGGWRRLHSKELYNV